MNKSSLVTKQMPKTSIIRGLNTTRVFSMFYILLYHFFPQFLPGGFLAVNVFFVFSGYLTHQSLRKEFNTTNTIDIKKYYRKRFQKLMPGYLLMLLASCLILFIGNPDYRVEIVKQVVAAFSFQTNWYEIFSGGSYEAQFIKHILVHTWFISVQVHFYLLWPWFVKFFMSKTLTQDEKSTDDRLKKAVLIAMISSYTILILGSIFKVIPVSFLYFSDFTRFSSFFAGAFLAHFLEDNKDLRLASQWIIPAFIVVLAVMAKVTKYEASMTYFATMPFIDILILVLLSACVQPIKRTKELRIYRYLSNLNYSIYLFHWPIYVIMSARFIKAGIFFTFILTGILVYINTQIWQPLFNGKEIVILKNKIKSPLRELVMIMVPILIVILTYIAQQNAPEMLSLEKSIWENSVLQDIQKVEDDKASLDNFILGEIGKREEAIRKEKEEKIRQAEEEYQKTIGEGESVDSLLNAETWPNQILVIADSVLLQPTQFLTDTIPNIRINAEGFRTYPQGVDALRQELEANPDIDVCVIALGTNHAHFEEQLVVDMMNDIRSGQRVIWVTPFNRDNPEVNISDTIRKLASNYPYLSVMDWDKFSSAHVDLFDGTDGIHFGWIDEANNAYRNLLIESINEVMEKTAK